nr:PREDICTED: PH domain leucine-rich repeat-containing protein phosphatase 2-like [Linepithema humile]
MSDISDISKSLLAQYYGFSKKLKTNKILIHEYVSSVENSVNEFIGEKSIVHANSDVTSGETYMQENVENEDRNSEFDVPVRSSRTLEWEAFEDDEKTLSKFDIILEANVMDNSYKKAGAPSDNETHNLALYSDKISTILDLTNASLTSLPIEMVEKYPMIKMLYLENNNLRELPKELFVLLTHLQWLDIRNNQLTSLPTSIQSHSSLETILLQGNKIEKLPLELCLVPKLKILNVANNPIIVPPKDIIALGCSSILNYLRAEWNKLHPDKSITLMEQKIEPKPSTILCYQSLCEKRRKLIKSCKVQVPKDTNDISHSFKDASVGKKNKGHESSSKYSDMQINTFLENSRS